MNDKQTGPAIDRTFLTMLQNHRGGQCIGDVSAAMKQLTAAVQLTRKGGEVVLRMKLKPATESSAETLIFETKIKVTAPELAQPASIFYADGDFNLVRENPNQRTMDLREVTQPAAVELQEVTNERD